MRARTFGTALELASSWHCKQAWTATGRAIVHVQAAFREQFWRAREFVSSRSISDRAQMLTWASRIG